MTAALMDYLLCKANFKSSNFYITMIMPNNNFVSVHSGASW